MMLVAETLQPLSNAMTRTQRKITIKSIIKIRLLTSVRQRPGSAPEQGNLQRPEESSGIAPAISRRHTVPQHLIVPLSLHLL